MRAKKKISRWKNTDGIIPSIFLSVNHWRNNDVSDYGICSKYFTTLCKIPKNSFCL
jgi:hypothetical protein